MQALSDLARLRAVNRRHHETLVLDYVSSEQAQRIVIDRQVFAGLRMLFRYTLVNDQPVSRGKLGTPRRRL